MRDSLGLALTMIIFVMLIGVIFIWAYNFIAVSDNKIFDDENKYINPTITNPDIETNYKDTYVNKNKFTTIWINLLGWFGGLKGIFVIAFLFIFLTSLILKNRKSIIDNIKNMFD